MARITEIKEFTVNRKVTTGFRCDHCGNTSEGAFRPATWHTIMAEGKFGLDVKEKTYHGCCPDCYYALLKRALYHFFVFGGVKIDGFDVEFLKRLLGLEDATVFTLADDFKEE